jgi:hypothetical protein
LLGKAQPRPPRGPANWPFRQLAGASVESTPPLNTLARATCSLHVGLPRRRGGARLQLVLAGSQVVDVLAFTPALLLHDIAMPSDDQPRHPPLHSLLHSLLLSRNRGRLGGSLGRRFGFSFGPGAIESDSGGSAPGAVTMRKQVPAAVDCRMWSQQQFRACLQGDCLSAVAIVGQPNSRLLLAFERRGDRALEVGQVSFPATGEYGPELQLAFQSSCARDD